MVFGEAHLGQLAHLILRECTRLHGRGRQPIDKRLLSGRGNAGEGSGREEIGEKWSGKADPPRIPMV
jgi:hypothetical protein